MYISITIHPFPKISGHQEIKGQGCISLEGLGVRNNRIFDHMINTLPFSWLCGNRLIAFRFSTIDFSFYGVLKTPINSHVCNGV